MTDALREARGEVFSGDNCATFVQREVSPKIARKSAHLARICHASSTSKNELRRSATSQQKRECVLASCDGTESAAARRTELRRRIMALVGRRREVYSVEVAAALGLRLSRVSTHLRALEQEGALVSRFEPPGERGCTSGLGRRYFRLATKVGGRNG